MCLLYSSTYMLLLQGKSLAQEGEPLPASNPPGLLARLVTEADVAPVAAAISPCGSFAASSTSECTTLLAIFRAPLEDEGTPGGIAAVRVQEPLPPSCCLCFLQSRHKGQDGECWLVLGCMDGRLLGLQLDVSCEGALGPLVTIQLPEEDGLRKAASLQNDRAPASAFLLL